MAEISDSKAGSPQATFCLTVNGPINTLEWFERRHAPLRTALKLANTLTGAVLNSDQRRQAALVQDNLLDFARIVVDEGEDSAVRLEIAFFDPDLFRRDGDDERSYFKISVYLPGHLPEDRWVPDLSTETVWQSMAVHGLSKGQCGREISGTETVLWAEFEVHSVG